MQDGSPTWSKPKGRLLLLRVTAGRGLRTCWAQSLHVECDSLGKANALVNVTAEVMV